VAVARAATPDTIMVSNFAYGPLSWTVAPETKITVMNKDHEEAAPIPLRHAMRAAA
jgi:hypothetical protein